MPREGEHKVVRVIAKRCTEVTVYPQFCSLTTGMSIPETIHICQDDGAGIAFVDEDAKKTFIRQMYNMTQDEKERKQKEAEERYRKNLKELHRRRCKK